MSAPHDPFGPEGAGIGYIRREWVERLHPIGVGAFSVVNPLGENKGINLPGIPVKVPSLTEKDEEDLRFAFFVAGDVFAAPFDEFREFFPARHGSEDRRGQLEPR